MPLAITPNHRLIAASAVAVSHTGDVNETTLATITIPANAMGLNGRVLVNALYSMTNNANAKTLRIRWGGIGGSIMASAGLSSVATWRAQAEWANRAATNSQVGGPNNTNASFNASSSAATTATQDTTTAITVVLTAQLANSADTATLEHYSVEILR